MEMGFQFATRNREMAMHHLAKCYPSAEITDEVVAELMPLIEADVVRVQDPDFHQPAQIVPGTNWTEDRRAEVVSVCQRMHDALTAK
jgi:hypothetical protein